MLNENNPECQQDEKYMPLFEFQLQQVVFKPGSIKTVIIISLILFKLDTNVPVLISQKSYSYICVQSISNQLKNT